MELARTKDDDRVVLDPPWVLKFEEGQLVLVNERTNRAYGAGDIVGFSPYSTASSVVLRLARRGNFTPDQLTLINYFVEMDGLELPSAENF